MPAFRTSYAAEEPRPFAVGRADRAVALAVAAGGPLFIGYAAVAAVLALVSALATGTGFSTVGVLAAAGPGWLVACHVPVEIGGHELGVLPLLPTVLLMSLAGRAAAGAADRLGTETPVEALPVLGTIGGAHAVFGVALAISTARPGLSCSPVAAFFLCGVLAAVAAGLGLSGRCGLRQVVLSRADSAVLLGLRAALVGGVTLLAVSCLVLCGGLIGSWSTVVGMYRTGAPQAGSAVGMLLLALMYLPNVLVGVCSFVAGPGVSIGTASAGPFAFHPGAVPGVPVLAVLPDSPARWWPVLLLLPAGVGAVVGWFCRRSDEPRSGRLRAVLVAALTVAVAALVLAALSGGALAGGPFDPVVVPAGLFGVAVFGWLGAGGSVVAWLAGNPFDEPAEEPEPLEPEPFEDLAEDSAEEPAEDPVET